MEGRLCASLSRRHLAIVFTGPLKRTGQGETHGVRTIAATTTEGPRDAHERAPTLGGCGVGDQGLAVHGDSFGKRFEALSSEQGRMVKSLYAAVNPRGRLLWRQDLPSRPCTATPMAAPANSAATKAGTSAGAMPAKLSVNMRPKAAAGFANDVDAVNQ